MGSNGTQIVPSCSRAWGVFAKRKSKEVHRVSCNLDGKGGHRAHQLKVGKNRLQGVESQASKTSDRLLLARPTFADALEPATPRGGDPADSYLTKEDGQNFERKRRTLYA
jgi:hypothetical protein